MYEDRAVMMTPSAAPTEVRPVAEAWLRLLGVQCSPIEAGLELGNHEMDNRRVAG
jgi:hypothetical protein